MAEFESPEDFKAFSQCVRFRTRHLLDAASLRFLATLIETCEKRKRTMEKGRSLWRAQLGHAWEVEEVEVSIDGGVAKRPIAAPFGRERMIPLLDRASEGRVNPKGIPCLYLSTEMRTAMTEVRPWVGSFVSVANFRVLKDLMLVDCSSDVRRGWSVFGDYSPEEREKMVWEDINDEFSKPVLPSDNLADYVPTQVLAEAFRNSGYDGVIYQSKLGKGQNIALFGLSNAELVCCHLYRAESVRVHFEFESQPWEDSENDHLDREDSTGCDSES